MDDAGVGVPASETRARLFLRFLRFGTLAWGGPVAQIAMIREELVERERWISRERFNRTLAVYQALPGPEAHELCVYFGHLAHGRVGGVLAGLGFMLPGFALMLALAWAYVRFGLSSAAVAAVFAGFAPAVAALIARAVIRIGRHQLTSPALWFAGIAAVAAQLLDVPFWLALVHGGAVAALAARARWAQAAALSAAAIALGSLFAEPGAVTSFTADVAATGPPPSLAALAALGLRAGLLTFGGAYTAIPFVQRDAVLEGRWLSNERFLDGIALGGILPAPLIIFGTFVGYVGAGFDGAVVVTAGVFLPAFAFTLIGHRHLERLVHEPAVHAFLDGVTAAAVGLIAATSARILGGTLDEATSIALFAAAFVALTIWRAKAAIPAVVLAAGIAGYALDRL